VALEEINRILETPLAELMETEEKRTEVESLAREAAAAPVMTRLRQVVAFVGPGRPVTQAGNLKAADAVALARHLDTGESITEQVTSLRDLPVTAHAYGWAVAAGFLHVRATKVVAGPGASDLERDPLSAWLAAAVTLLNHGLLDGFRQGWRKSYVELLDQAAPGLLASLAAAGGTAPLSSIEQEGWRLVVADYGYDDNDAAERGHVERLVNTMVAQLVGLGAVARHDDDVALTELGALLGVGVALALEDDEEDLDLVDTDAESLLATCHEEMGPAEATAHLLAWCQARPAREAAGELCEALLDGEDDPEVWALGLEALRMLDPAVAGPALDRLASHPTLEGLASALTPRQSDRPRRKKKQ
jgi:hypothetical protein